MATRWTKNYHPVLQLACSVGRKVSSLHPPCLLFFFLQNHPELAEKTEYTSRPSRHYALIQGTIHPVAHLQEGEYSNQPSMSGLSQLQTTWVGQEVTCLFLLDWK